MCNQCSYLLHFMPLSWCCRSVEEWLENTYNQGCELKRLYFLTAVILAGWTIFILTNLFWNLRQDSQNMLTFASIEARSNFNKDKALRFWASHHGGVYVPATKKTSPNPNLAHIPERDIVTPSGKQMTLMNPAYMLRQVMDEYSDLYGIKGKITSTKLLNPDNAPDAWQLAALHAFNQGEEEVLGVSRIDGEPYFRLCSRCSPMKAA